MCLQKKIKVSSYWGVNGSMIFTTGQPCPFPPTLLFFFFFKLKKHLKKKHSPSLRTTKAGRCGKELDLTAKNEQVSTYPQRSPAACNESPTRCLVLASLQQAARRPSFLTHHDPCCRHHNPHHICFPVKTGCLKSVFAFDK